MVSKKPKNTLRNIELVPYAIDIIKVKRKLNIPVDFIKLRKLIVQTPRNQASNLIKASKNFHAKNPFQTAHQIQQLISKQRIYNFHEFF